MDYRPIQYVLPEALIVGLLLIVFVVAVSYIISKGTYPDFSQGIFSQHYPQMYASLLLAGSLFHLVFEYTGGNAAFCKYAKFY